MLHFQEWVLLNKLTHKYDKALILFLKLKKSGKDINLAMHADLSVSSGNWQDDKTIKGAASRWESEEQVKGPIPITKQYGLIAIEVLKSVIDKHVKYPVKVREEMIKKYVEEKIPKVKEGYFWNDVKKDWDIIFTSGQKKRHNLEKYRQNIEKIKQEIEEYKTFPDKIPNLKIVNSF